MLNKHVIVLSLMMAAACISTYANALDIRTIRAEAKGAHDILAVQDDTSPVISVKLLFPRAGYVYEHKSYRGVGGIVASIMQEGGGRASPQEFRATLERLHAGFSVSSGREHVTLTVTALKPYIGYALEHVIDVVAAPAYTNADMELYLTRARTALKELRDTPSYIASRALAEMIYPDTPYNRAGTGDEVTLQSLTPDVLSAYHFAAFDPSHMRISVAGDLDDESVKQLFDGVRTRLYEKRPAPPIAVLPNTVLSTKAGTPAFAPEAFTHRHITRDIPQTVIMFAMPSVTRTHPDFFKHYVANYLLGGGGFESRLMETLREQQGLAYSVSTSLDYHSKGGVLYGSAGTSPEKAEQFIEGIRSELVALASPSAFSEATVLRAKSYLLHSFELAMVKNSSIAGMLSSLQSYGFGTDYINVRRNALKAVNLKHIQRIFRSSWQSNRLAVVTVGRDPIPSEQEEAPQIDAPFSKDAAHE